MHSHLKCILKILFIKLKSTGTTPHSPANVYFTKKILGRIFIFCGNKGNRVRHPMKIYLRLLIIHLCFYITPSFAVKQFIYKDNSKI